MAESVTYDEKRVLELLGQGSEFALIQLYDKYNKQIYRAALKFLDSKEQAEDVVQEVFLDVWLRKEEITNVINIKAFLHAMTKNLVYKNFRQQSYARLASEDFARQVVSENATEATINSLDIEKLLLNAIASLSETQRQVFMMANEQGLSHKQIADKLNLTVLAVTAHKKRALREIRLYMKPHLGASLGLIMFVFGGN